MTDRNMVHSRKSSNLKTTGLEELQLDDDSDDDEEDDGDDELFVPEDSDDGEDEGLDDDDDPMPRGERLEDLPASQVCNTQRKRNRGKKTKKNRSDTSNSASVDTTMDPMLVDDSEWLTATTNLPPKRVPTAPKPLQQEQAKAATTTTKRKQTKKKRERPPNVVHDNNGPFKPAREYYHSRSFLKIKENEWDKSGDSDDELDQDWLDEITKSDIHDFTDITIEEKKLILLWNFFLRSDTVIKAKKIPQFCLLFIEKHHVEIRDQGLDQQLPWHLANLWDEGLISSDHLAFCLEYYRNLAATATTAGA